MSLSVDQVRRVATLAHLSLTDDDEKELTVKLSGILDYIDQLSELDTSDVQPTSHSLEINNVFREDEAKKTFGEDTWQENAPAKDHGHYTVPRVVEG
ncbi:Aspartyl-tRNA(Asn) amidotransferase subunit C @ Glutamyl-tRNA(Gln) amidotransferase subunit C [hydrothermal vent metagenome]|uniref:Aspartyl-tRNA(Asn) amidotransferase subunit C @ Glutamyl-tRNA(Gln) amidotransferase subunit C n=1 Tax=hydrothermal vent metagenome TaxID=652676 RepID=A0A3B1CWG3_9ZZZZ